MGASGAVEILHSSDDPSLRPERIEEYTRKFANPLLSAQRGFVDDIINPEETRRRICGGLDMLEAKNLPNLPRKHSNVPL